MRSAGRSDGWEPGIGAELGEADGLYPVLTRSTLDQAGRSRRRTADLFEEFLTGPTVDWQLNQDGVPFGVTQILKRFEDVCMRNSFEASADASRYSRGDWGFGDDQKTLRRVETGHRLPSG